MTTLQQLYRKRRVLRAAMKEAGIKRCCTMNRLGDQAWQCNRQLEEIEAAIRKAK